MATMVMNRPRRRNSRFLTSAHNSGAAVFDTMPQLPRRSRSPVGPVQSQESPEQKGEVENTLLMRNRSKRLFRLSSSNRRLIRRVSKTSLLGRTVRFNENDDGKMNTTVHVYKRPSPRHWPDLYLSQREKAEVQFLAQSEGEAFLFEDEELVEQLEFCYASCGRDDDVVVRDNAANEQALLEWVKRGVRGLEETVSEEFEDRRIQTVSMILEYQKYLKDTVGSMSDCDELLRAYCEKRSRQTREFSLRIAGADAMFVAQNDR